jgi:hypothetical protein
MVLVSFIDSYQPQQKLLFFLCATVFSSFVVETFHFILLSTGNSKDGEESAQMQ